MVLNLYVWTNFAKDRQLRRLSKIFFTELASAPQLIIEAIFLDNLVSTLLQATFTPVSVPPDDLISMFGIFRIDHITGPCSSFIDLFERLPAG